MRHSSLLRLTEAQQKQLNLQNAYSFEINPIKYKELLAYIFLSIIILLEFLKLSSLIITFSDNNQIYLSEEQFSFIQILLIFIQGILIYQKRISNYFWILTPLIIAIQFIFKQKMAQSLIINYFSIFKIIYFIAFSLQIYQKQYKINTDLISLQFHKYQRNPQNFIIEIMKKTQYYQKKISEKDIKQFFLKLNGSYKQISYHNLTHGFDVMTSMYKYLEQFQLKDKVCVDEVDFICCLIAAYAHDVGHKGFTNYFYITTNDKLACQHAFQSPLEKMHCSILMNLLRNYNNLVPQQNKKWMAKMILATDNMTCYVQHDLFIQRKEILKQKNLQQKDRILIKQILIHASDISPPTKSFQMANKWGDMLFLEFQNQYKTLKKMSLADPKPKTTSIKSKQQVGFYDKMVLPLFKQLCQISPYFKKILQSATSNRNQWKKMYDQAIKKQQKS